MPRPEKPKDERKTREKNLIKTLKNISIRIPLLAFGADVESEDEFRLDNFASLIDDKSWVEFMPEDFPKATEGSVLGFDYFKQFIDEDIFAHKIVWAAAGTDHAFFPVEPERLLEIAGGIRADIKK